MKMHTVCKNEQLYRIQLQKLQKKSFVRVINLVFGKSDNSYLVLDNLQYHMKPHAVTVCLYCIVDCS